MHGAVIGTIGEGEDAETVDPTGVATWIERVVSDRRVVFTLAGHSSPGGALWIDGGIVPAGAIGVGDEEPVKSEDLAGDPDSEIPGPMPPHLAGGDVVDVAEITPMEIHVTQEVVHDEPDALDERPAIADPEDNIAASPDVDEGEVAEFDFTHLVDHTVYRDSRDAEVRPNEPELLVESAPTSGELEEAQEVEASSVATGPGSETIPPEPTESIPALIDSVPQAGESGPVPIRRGADLAPPVGGVPFGDRPGDHDGHTVARGSGGNQSPSGGPAGDADPKLVNGVLCPQGHANSPVADRCMICREVLTDRAVRRMARPALGRLVLPSGEMVEIDRPVVIGRMPVATELIGGEVPLTVKIDDDVVTRNHAQILIDEWHVLIVDLDSTNETMVTIPGQTPRVLVPHDPCVLLAGTVIDLGGFGPVVFEGPG